MITGFALVCLHVLDLDEAKAFYVETLGFEVGIDHEMDGFRWLTVHPPGRADQPMMLVVPEPPLVDPATAEQLRSLIARGYLGLGALQTDDCWATYRELTVKGVEFTEPPEERFYGIDAGFRDPFGNAWRLTQPRNLGEIRETVAGAAPSSRAGGHSSERSSERAPGPTS
jgi:catechol 2,3-dioxygenase-like lactoylglutathione lyase family enzyme